ncbi:MAG: FtsX-like permease family protein [Promethearchaeota archaeon]|jgi:ABC-type lipoprotein release transport system permease subunit
MSFLDFALKDFYRKKSQTYPYLSAIIIVIAITEYLIYFTSSLGLNIFLQPSFYNEFYFKGSINAIYTEFNTLIQILLMVLVVSIVVAITTTLVINKKKDIAIMRSLGTLPQKLYSFYLLEVYIIFFIGFIIGLILGLFLFGISSLIMNAFYISFPFQFDLIFTPILLVTCCLGIFFITGYTLRKIGKQEIIKTFSKDIPFDYDASKKLQFIPKWLSSLGVNLKMSVINTLRRRGEFKRYFVVFSLISTIIFTLALGTIVLSSSSRQWINKSQGENIVVFGHEEVISNYSLMYKMFSDPDVLIDSNTINFTDPDYLFNVSDVEEIKNLEGVEGFDERLISFYETQEIQGFHYFEDPDSEWGGSYKLVGQNREVNIPIIGVNPENIIPEFETEGKFFSNEDAYDNMTIGDGLAYNIFDFALDQSLKLTTVGATFHISGVIIDAFYSGYAGYIGLNESRGFWNLTSDEVNLLVLKIDPNFFDDIVDELENISIILGSDFTYLQLDSYFINNLKFISSLSFYPMFLIIVIAILAILSLYNYQKSGIMEKARDFLVMRAIGSNKKSLKKILFMESIYVIIPSLLLSIGIGMIINAIILFARVTLPSILVPLSLYGILFSVLTLFNYLSLIPIMRKIDKFSINDFNIY